MIRALRARVVRNAVLDLQLVDARGLLITTPARAQARVVVELVEQVEPRPELLLGILDIGLLVPAQADLGREPRHDLHARREVRREMIALG